MKDKYGGDPAEMIRAEAMVPMNDPTLTIPIHGAGHVRWALASRSTELSR